VSREVQHVTGAYRKLENPQLVIDGRDIFKFKTDELNNIKVPTTTKSPGVYNLQGLTVEMLSLLFLLLSFS
jgi:hypothetical protein